MARSTEQSLEWYERAQRLMPGGVSSPVRAFRSVGGSPVYFREAAGARFVDEDGNFYVDYCMSWGPLILGHAHPRSRWLSSCSRVFQQWSRCASCRPGLRR
jgi:glutamate-1-semialdehyde 2,1-aminomutase